uniref:Uncharacterized protein n=1 Tax=Rousettus aegyptiacus TaxID=9407 RepID=A0A7J8FI34_ROUAE|nr:hypothetical protein HJG63_011830 [Rousettus aegyptiacus]
MGMLRVPSEADCEVPEKLVGMGDGTGGGRPVGMEWRISVTSETTQRRRVRIEGEKTCFTKLCAGADAPRGASGHRPAHCSPGRGRGSLRRDMGHDELPGDGPQPPVGPRALQLRARRHRPHCLRHQVGGFRAACLPCPRGPARVDVTPA